MDNSKSHVHECKQTEVRIQEQEQSTTHTSNHKTQPEHAKRKLQTKAHLNLADTGGGTLDQLREVNKNRCGVQGRKSGSEPNIGAPQVVMPSAPSVNPVSGRFKNNQDIHNTCNSQQQREERNSNAKAEKRIMRVLPSRAAP